MQNIQNTFANMDSTVLFICTVLFFLFLVAIGMAVAYMVTYMQNSKTAMNGVMCVKVALNEWPEQEKEGFPYLDCGQYLIGMADLDGEMEYPFHPFLNWQERAEIRRYPVSAFLGRFLRSTHSAVSSDEPMCSLLGGLLRKGAVCGELGYVQRRNAARGLRATGKLQKKDSINPDKVKVYSQIPENISETFLHETGCAVDDVCITLEYLEQGNI